MKKSCFILDNISNRFERIYSSIESEVYVGFLNNEKVVLKKRILKKDSFEGEIYKRLELAGVKSPRFILEDVDNGILLISFLNGSSLEDNELLFNNALLWKNVAEDLLLLRTISCIGYGKITDVSNSSLLGGELSSWLDFFKEFEDKLSLFDGDNIIKNEEINVIRNYWFKNKSSLSIKIGHLNHGDFCLDHIWMDNGRYAGIIDFGDAFIGDSLMDIAYFKLKNINKNYGDLVFNNLYSSYLSLVNDERNKEERNKLINMYMIYWAINRLIGINDDNLKRAFAIKTSVLAGKLSQ